MKNKNKRLGLRELTKVTEEFGGYNKEAGYLDIPEVSVEDSLVELMDSDIIENVIETDKEKTLEISADLLYIDDEHQLTRHALYSRCVPMYENPVAVVNSSNKIIGSAVLERNGKILTCTMFIDYATPERLDIENESPVYAHIIGHSRVETWATKNRIRELFVEQIMLTNSPTFDPRITKITKS